jgi:hypothetical protein
MQFPFGKLGVHPKFAGNFARILETFFRADKKWISTRTHDIVKIIEFAISNVHVLSYQFLLFRLASDFGEILAGTLNYPPGKLITEILKSAAAHCLFGHVLDPNYDPEALDKASLCTGQRERLDLVLARRRVLTYPETAINMDGKPLPLPSWYGRSARDQTVKIDSKGATFSGPRKTRYEARRKLLGKFPENVEWAKTKSYLLLSCVRSMVNENPELWGSIQCAEKDYQCIQFLLMCGIYAEATSKIVEPTSKIVEPTSMIASAAFQIVTVALNGSPPEDLNVNPLWGIDAVEAIIAAYAADFEFRLQPTIQMRYAFPVFWNHRYERRIESVGRPVTIDLKTSIGKPVSLKVPGMTPLELYGRYLVDDPSLNDGLCGSIRAVLKYYEEESKRVREDASANPETEEERVMAKDAALFNLLRTKFTFGDRQITFRDLKMTIPMAGSDPFWQSRKERDVIFYPAPVSSWGAWFAEFLRETDMFQLKAGCSAGDMASLADQPSDTDSHTICVQHGDMNSLIKKSKDPRAVSRAKQENFQKSMNGD